MVNSESWEFLEELPFLATIDDEEDSIVLNTNKLHSKNIPLQVSTIHSKPIRSKLEGRRKQSFKARQRQEIEDLKDEIKRLEGKLNFKQTMTCRTMSFWERMAKAEFIERKRAQKDQQTLHNTMDEQGRFLQLLEKLLQKPPSLLEESQVTVASFTSALHLPSDKKMRTQVMHSIVDREYQKMNTEFLRAGISDFDMPDTFSANIRPDVLNNVVFEVVEHLEISGSFRNVGEAVWEAFTSSILHGIRGINECIQQVEPYQLVYNTSVDHRNFDIACYSHVLYKRYFLDDSQIIVGRSALYDDLFPDMAQGAIESVCSWLRVKALSRSTCRLTLLLKLNLGPPEPIDHMEANTLENMLANMSIAQKPQVQGQFPPVPACRDLDVSAIPLRKWRLHAERGMRLERAFKSAVNRVVQGNTYSIIPSRCHAA